MKVIVVLLLVFSGFQAWGKELQCENPEDVKYIHGKKTCTNWSESEAPIDNRCEEAYVPPHDVQELAEVEAWAVGRAFLIFADKAGYLFDGDQYGEDNPYPALFYFGFATAKNCISQDVIVTYRSMLDHLARVYTKYDDGTYQSHLKFQEVYLKLADSYKMIKYLTPQGQLI